MFVRFLGLLFMALVAGQTFAAEGDYVIRNFTFTSGETLPELRIHYRTLGKPTKDAHGMVRNAVLIGHGTGGTGAAFLKEAFEIGRAHV